jgi:ABC-type arginine/histidine transport system permease subunit
MRWRLGGGGGFGVTRWVVKVEHALTLALLAIIIGGINLFFASLIQAGYSSVATAFMTAYFRLCAATPFYVWILIILFGIGIFLTVGGKNE